MSGRTVSFGIDLGGTFVKAVAVDGDGRVLAEETLPTTDDGSAEWRERVRTVCRTLQRAFPEVRGAGLCAPGLPSADQRSIATLPERLRGLEGLVWSDFLGLPTVVLNDAQAALLGEVSGGAAQGASNAVLLTLGTGVGGAVLAEGRLLRGRSGRAGHLGHVSLNPEGAPDLVGTPGSLEDAIGDCTVRARSGGRFATTKELVAAVESGDADAARVWARSTRALAAAIAGFINIFDPEIVVLGGGIAAAGETLFAPLRAHLDVMEWRVGPERVRLVAAGLGARAGALGAAWRARDQIFP